MYAIVQRDLIDLVIKPRSPALQAISLSSEPPGKSMLYLRCYNNDIVLFFGENTSFKQFYAYKSSSVFLLSEAYMKFVGCSIIILCKAQEV